MCLFIVRISGWSTSSVKVEDLLSEVRRYHYLHYTTNIFFLSGADAAHIHSPTGGQGMNSSVQDSVSHPYSTFFHTLTTLLSIFLCDQNIVQSRMEACACVQTPRTTFPPKHLQRRTCPRHTRNAPTHLETLEHCPRTQIF